MDLTLNRLIAFVARVRELSFANTAETRDRVTARITNESLYDADRLRGPTIAG